MATLTFESYKRCFYSLVSRPSCAHCRDGSQYASPAGCSSIITSGNAPPNSRCSSFPSSPRPGPTSSRARTADGCQGSTPARKTHWPADGGSTSPELQCLDLPNTTNRLRKRWRELAMRGQAGASVSQPDVWRKCQRPRSRSGNPRHVNGRTEATPRPFSVDSQTTIMDLSSATCRQGRVHKGIFWLWGSGAPDGSWCG